MNWTYPSMITNAVLMICALSLFGTLCKLRVRTTVFLVPCAFLLILMAAIAEMLLLRQNPSVLTIHAPQGAWTSITIQSENLPAPLTFHSDPVIVTPVKHGFYVMEIRFNDSTAVWAKLFHLNAGVRRKVDVFVQRSTPQLIKFTQTVNTDETVFRGTTLASDTASDKPYYLERVP